MARLLMCHDHRSPLLTWQAPPSRRGHTGFLALLQGACAVHGLGCTPPSWPRERAKRGTKEGARVEPTRDFAPLHLQFVDQSQWRYALIRPLVLCADGPPTQRAADTHTPPDTLRTFLRRFRQAGMLGLLPTESEVAPRPRASRGPEAVRQERARLKALDHGLQDREIGRMIFYKCGDRLHPKTGKRLWQQSQPAKQHGRWAPSTARATATRRESKSSRSLSRAGPSAVSGASCTSPARRSIGGCTALRRSPSRV
jgi:hypothetical protein